MVRSPRSPNGNGTGEGRSSSASENIEKWLAASQAQGQAQGQGHSSPRPGFAQSPRINHSTSSPSMASPFSSRLDSADARLSLHRHGSTDGTLPVGGDPSFSSFSATSPASSATQQSAARALSAAFADLQTSGPGVGSPGQGFRSVTPSAGDDRPSSFRASTLAEERSFRSTTMNEERPFRSSTIGGAAPPSSRSEPVSPYYPASDRKPYGSPRAGNPGAASTYSSSSHAPQGYVPRQEHHSPRRYGQAPESIRSAPAVPAPLPAVSAENEKLYEAYNELHSLAQIFRKPFDAPAILIVGHQTDGKSALVEALMGFQFNHVGGGTKTRRPITLQMVYNPHRAEPRCFLVLDKELGREEEKTLGQLQAYIERENQRLDMEGGRFSESEIVLRMEYKYCPNLTIIDTPGLISAAPGQSHSILQDQAATVEALVVAKMQQREFVILCLEDSNDWNNATTRKVVMLVDPDLSRTILVSTKLDTKIPQFSRAADVEMFLNPSLPGVSSTRIGNKPFFTSVPSGRVGKGHDCVFFSDEQFREAVLAQERTDVQALETKMGRPLSEDERSRIGVGRLRLFLEQLLQHRYLESVPFIVPLLEGELKSIASKLAKVRSELKTLSDKELKEKSRDFRDKFMAQLTLLLRGTITAPPETFGETLEDERARGGAFIGEGGQQLPWRNMPNASMRLYGGAQYHRAVAEFRFVTGAVGCPSISREEIVNSCGVEDVHDGTNYYRTACVIAVKKAWDVFEPFLRQLGYRLSHIVRRLFPVVIYLLKKEKEPMLQHELFVDHVASSFHNFVDSTEASCIEKCIEDLTSTTRFVSWTLHQKNQNAFRSFLESSLSQSPALILEGGSMYPRGAPTGQPTAGGGAGPGLGFGGSPLQANRQPAPESAGQSGLVKLLGSHMSSGSSAGSTHDVGPTSQVEAQGSGTADADGGQPGAAPADAAGGALPGVGTSATRLADVLEGSLWTRRLAPSSEELVNALVGRIFTGVRDHFVLSSELKFNCFFLMPLLDKYPARLREDLEQVASGDAEAVFDISRTRRQLERQEVELEEELSRMQALQAKFAGIHRSLTLTPGPSKP